MFAAVLATLAAFVVAIPDAKAAPAAAPKPDPQFFYNGYYGYAAPAVYYG